MLELGLAEKELLVKHGLSDKLLDDLGTTVAEYEGSITASNTSREDHISAGAQLTRVSEEILQLVGMMDGINRYRFGNDPDLLVAWDAAKHVASGPQPKAEAPADGVGTPAGTGAGGQPGEVKPAA
jgi:hypothetical protein